MTEIYTMIDTPKKHDKPNDPPYSGGEDESGKDEETKREVNDSPVDESDDDPSAA